MRRNAQAGHKQQFVGAATQARDSVVEMGEAARGVARDQIVRLRDEVASLRDEFVERIEQKPMRSVLIAAGVGLLLGVFFGRR